jgi:hypothetical protein
LPPIILHSGYDLQVVRLVIGILQL